MADVEQTGEAGTIVGQADVSEADLAHAVTQLPGSKRPWLVPLVIAGVALLSLGVSLPSLGRETTLTVLLPLAFVVVLNLFFQRAARRAWIKQAFANIGGQSTFRFETPTAFLIYTTPRTDCPEARILGRRRGCAQPPVARAHHAAAAAQRGDFRRRAAT